MAPQAQQALLAMMVRMATLVRPGRMVPPENPVLLDLRAQTEPMVLMEHQVKLVL